MLSDTARTVSLIRLHVVAGMPPFFRPRTGLSRLGVPLFTVTFRLPSSSRFIGGLLFFSFQRTPSAAPSTLTVRYRVSFWCLPRRCCRGPRLLDDSLLPFSFIQGDFVPDGAPQSTLGASSCLSCFCLSCISRALVCFADLFSSWHSFDQD